MSVFARSFNELSQWQTELATALDRYADWMQGSGHADEAAGRRLLRLRERLGKRRVSVAFVAEFSRGKSELINALFFADLGQRIVPSSAGRTTMCPTELAWNPAIAPSVALLPIASRLDERSLDAWRGEPSAWSARTFDPGDVASLRLAMTAVQETDQVSPQRAAELGLLDGEDLARAQASGEDVEIPRWRHAVLNYRHWLLEAGLTIIDTPGLNALGSEPELTLNLIPNADAVLFVLAADTGVTRSDIEVWKTHVAPSHSSGRFVVLNKIDGLWDELKSPAQVDAEIAAQAARVAATLELPADQVFPVSAHKGLVARVHKDPALLARSRLEPLEQALVRSVLPRQRQLLLEMVEREVNDLAEQTGRVLSERERHAGEQLLELQGLRGKNRDVMNHMATRIRVEREEFDRSLRQLHGLRAVFGRHSAALIEVTGADRMKTHVRDARDMMSESRLSSGLRDGMRDLFGTLRGDFDAAEGMIGEILSMMTAMYRNFSAEHGMQLGLPPRFSTRRFRLEIDRIDKLQRAQFGPTVMLTTEKWAVMRRFFELIVEQLRTLYRQVQEDVQGWLKAVMLPVETQVREYQSQLKRRLESVKRVLEASESLETRISQVASSKADALAQIEAFERLLKPLRLMMSANGQGLEPSDTEHDLEVSEV